MQDRVENIPHWLSQALTAVATFLAGGVGYKYLLVWLNRHKPAAEVYKSHAETTEITIRSQSTAVDTVNRMFDLLDKTQERIDNIRDERDSLKMRVDLQEKELALQDKQVKKLKAILTIKGIKLSDFDGFKGD